jgi:uncharacterized peroxidase-related enzyme
MYQTVRGRAGFDPNWVEAFSLRPEVWKNWDLLWASVRSNLPPRIWELATLAAARAIRSSYCSLAHGRVLAEKFFDAASVTAIATDRETAPIEMRERAVMDFAEKVAVAADQITQADIDGLRAHGFSDAEIFDIAAVAAARCFFSKMVDAMGALPDAALGTLDPAMRDALTVGRPIAGTTAGG